MEATSVAVIVLATSANEPRKVIAIRLDAKSRAVADPVGTRFVTVIHKTI